MPQIAYFENDDQEISKKDLLRVKNKVNSLDNIAESLVEIAQFYDQESTESDSAEDIDLQNQKYIIINEQLIGFNFM